MRAKKLTLAALALAAGLSLTACQQGEDSNASANVADSSSSSSGTSGGSGGNSGGTSGGGNGGTSGGSAASADDAPGSGGGKITTGTCKTANLDFRSSHGMGEGDIVVTMKNTGGDACTLKGFPGVDLKSEEAGRPLSAKRSDVEAPVVNLQSGDETRFTLHYPPNTTGGSGVDVTTMVVTPPNETHSTSLPVRINLPVEESADQKVTVDPVGTGKQ
ncbi:DUF4232 domain-containing protein [Streptomyces tubbatahanensis]|uniref:DUF4232 domain-containing protein n=1 Tax=Streptomyces tubbatahanensis TaxID=2923272 RepID=A0ABY3XTR5_9ACTN|nr:DUF4232 domain-containing protein [Streptomyces tubbatahanensis]UNS97867.1 DUF4232 domain-containing protein [Streptomyces tubbatahanensis]